MAKKIVTWVLVGDGAHARVYANDGPGRGLYRPLGRDFAVELPHDVRDVVADRPGRMINPGRGGPQTRSPRTDPKKHLEEEFLREVASELDGAAEEKRYHRLVLVAPPKALGMLRSALGSHASALLAKELDKDLVKLTERELEQHLLAAEAIL